MGRETFRISPAVVRITHDHRVCYWVRIKHVCVEVKRILSKGLPFLQRNVSKGLTKRARSIEKMGDKFPKLSQWPYMFVQDSQAPRETTNDTLKNGRLSRGTCWSLVCSGHLQNIGTDLVPGDFLLTEDVLASKVAVHIWRNSVDLQL